jgi:hypothetical protein
VTDDPAGLGRKAEGMDTTVLVVAAAVIVLAGFLLTLSREPPFWMVLIVALITFPLSTALLDLPPLSGHGLAGEWSVRLAMIALGEGLLSLVSGRWAQPADS